VLRFHQSGDGAVESPPLVFEDVTLLAECGAQRQRVTIEQGARS
jgi:hypothetical protein